MKHKPNIELFIKQGFLEISGAKETPIRRQHDAPETDTETETETESISALSGGGRIFNLPPTPEADYYRRFKEVCGPNSGGLAKKLLNAHGTRIELARSVLELAATKGDAREFIGGTIRRLTQPVESVGGIS